MKFKTISTGGGFNGFYYPHPFGREKYGYFLITDSSGEQPPIKGEKCIVGWYTDDSDFLGYLDIDQWDQM
jgi:hypothetical protein